MDIINAITKGDSDGFWLAFNATTCLDSVLSGLNESARKKALRVLVDAPLCLPNINTDEYHGKLVFKFGKVSNRAQLFRMIKRTTACNIISAISDHMLICELLMCFKEAPCDSSLFYASLSSLKQFDSFTIHQSLLDSVVIYDDRLIQLVESGMVDIKVVQVLAVIYSDSLLDSLMSFWTENAEQDGQRQLYNAIVLAAILGNTPQIGIGTEVNIKLFEGVQKRLEQSGLANLIGRVMGELLLSTNDNRLCFKCDYTEPTARSLFDAYNLGRYLEDVKCQNLGIPTAMMTEPSWLQPKTKTKKTQSDEPMAKNDKSRVRAYLSDCISALNCYDDDKKRLEAINQLLLLLPMVNDTELQDHQMRLIDKLLSNLSSIAFVDRTSILQVRSMAILRLPTVMTTRIVECLFTPANIGLTEKVDLMTSVVRACQHSLHRVPIDGHQPKIHCKPSLIAMPFLSGCLDFIPKRRKLLHFQSGWFGERLLLAMATMLPAIPVDSYHVIMQRIADTVVGLSATGTNKALRKGALVLLLATAAQAKAFECEVTDCAAFIVHCGTVIETVMSQEGEGEVRDLALNLAGAIREAFPVELMMESVLFIDRDVPLLDLHI